MTNLVNLEVVTKAYGTRQLFLDVSLGVARARLRQNGRPQAWADDPSGRRGGDRTEHACAGDARIRGVLAAPQSQRKSGKPSPVRQRREPAEVS
ncbi:MAG: hypothetical protein ACRDWI_17760 [Jiangellaceae bacterium]